ncbi:NAD(P)/FAD-dependent oxidoreductase [Janthinobacterium agaricidamnosum]|uniref:NAD(P)/FAD-dependent oxidoreductase n=1 Tax=Janthinobacterium agaricidamnosum TaxID=55508 RepID=UPI000774A851|nr:FAD-dependent oxidoreductase [Janthinobacterium agaricidamnosum]
MTNKSSEILLATLIGSDIDAIVSRKPIAPDLLHAWAAARATQCYSVAVHVGRDAVRQQTKNEAKPAVAAADQSKAFSVSGLSESEAFTAAFAVLERASTLRIAPPLTENAGTRKPSGEQVVLLGAGIVNLITAHALLDAGYAVSLIDGGPDPRAAQPWTAYGCSRGGDDARMFTLSEMDNYNDKQASPEMNTLFKRSVADLGWNVHWNGTLAPAEKKWIEEFESIPIWLANRYNEDIFGFNRESLPMWEQWKADDPALFAASVLREDILRLYSDPLHYRAAVRRQIGIGAAKKMLTPAEIAAEHPGLADAVAGGHLAGAISAVGFTVNIHKFMHALLDRLEQRGASFAWHQRGQSLLFDQQRRVKGIRTSTMVVEAQHYVLSPGAYGDAILAGTRSQGKIHGVLGAWLRLPHTGPQLRQSLKLARKGHITEDSNVTLVTAEDGSDLLVIGSGYGHTGIDPRNIDEAQLHQIYQGLVDTARTYFPASYEAAIALGTLESSFKYCVRPWTSTGLGLFDQMPTSGGGRCITTGGHNTGGFAQSPSIAQAVVAALDGRHHPMHAAYHPQRAETFLSAIGHGAPSRRRDAEPALAG